MVFLGGGEKVYAIVGGPIMGRDDPRGVGGSWRHQRMHVSVVQTSGPVQPTSSRRSGLPASPTGNAYHAHDAGRVAPGAAERQAAARVDAGSNMMLPVRVRLVL